MIPSSLSVTVVIVFQKPTLYVNECLEALSHLEGGPWPLVLVPDKKIPEYNKFGIQVPCQGTIAEKRNRGIAAVPATCKAVAFIDSDAYPNPDWLIQATTILAEASEDVAGVTGPNLTPPHDPWLRRVPGYAIESRLIMGRGAYRFTDRLVSHLEQYPRATTCNMILRRNVFEQISGFNPALLTSEDVALVDALIAADLKIYYDIRIKVYHHRRNLLFFLVQHFNEGLHVRYHFRFRRSASKLVALPSLLVITELLLAVTQRFDILLGLQLLQLAIFIIERKAFGFSWKDTWGAAFAMWGFLKAYGFGSIFSLLGGDKFYIHNRRDPS